MRHAERKEHDHGDFGLGNTLGADCVVTAVVDRTHEGYGDPLWDVACLDLWWPQVGFAEAYVEAQCDAP
ncbi:phosphotransferase [Streptomyces sp. KR55]|uniref:phosphotransferase n=1 Tax=Streptomyces sp. KR55 TaxID=3457425 RepID=UPI003FCF8C8A